ncbi:MAG: hypothetical protein R2911_27160 [Caldilineaceae bacterium]
MSLPLAGAHAAYSTGASSWAPGNTVTLDTVTAAAGSSGAFAILLDNSDAVASGQLRFTFAATLGVEIAGVQITDRTTGFESIGSAYATGDDALLGYQILFYNLNRLDISPGAGPILTVAYSTTATATGSSPLHITQSILASAAAESLGVTAVDGALTIAEVPVTPLSHQLYLPLIHR